MRLLYLPVLILLCTFPFANLSAQADRIADLIKQAKTNELSEVFAANIDLNILGEENIYSKNQAEIVLNKFFEQYKPRSVDQLHNLNSNPNYRFSVLIVNTGNGKFRMAYTLKKENNAFVMIDMRIEKVK